MAVRFDLTGENYTSTDSPPATTFSVICWAQISVNRDEFSALWSTDSGTGSYCYLETASDGVTLKAYNSAGNILTGPTMTVGAWYRIGFTVFGTTATLYWGTETGALSSVTDASWPALSPAPTTLRIGASPFAVEWLNGRIAAFKHYSAVVLQPEMEREFSQYAPARLSNIIRFHPFVVAQTTDYSGANKTLSGGTGATTEDGPPIPWRVTPARIYRPAAAVTPVVLDGIASASGSLTGEAEVARPLTGSASAASDLTGSMSTDRPLAGSAPAASDLTGTATVTRGLQGAAHTASSATGGLDRSAGLAGTSAASGSLTGALDSTRSLSGSASSAATLAASLATARPLTATAATAASLTGDLSTMGQISLTGSASAAATATGTLSSARPITGQATAASGLTGSLATTRPLSGVVLAASSATGDLTVTFSPVPLTGSTGSAADFTGLLGITRQLAGQGSAADEATGSLSVEQPGEAGEWTTGPSSTAWSSGPATSTWSAGTSRAEWTSAALGV
jgi:hypothetical protein